jgi:hypothetical protein
MTEEKRKFIRVPFRGNAIMSYKNRTVEGIVEDVSMEGIFLRTLVQIEINNTVAISILGTPVSNATAKVVRVAQTGVGLQFEKTVFG